MDRMPQQFDIVAVEKSDATPLDLKNAERFMQRVRRFGDGLPQGFEIVDIAGDKMDDSPVEQGHNFDPNITAMDDRVDALAVQNLQGSRGRPNFPVGVTKNAYLHEAVSRSRIVVVNRVGTAGKGRLQ